MAFRLAATSSFAGQPASYAFSLLAIQALSWVFLLLASRKARSSQTENISAATPMEDSVLPMWSEGVLEDQTSKQQLQPNLQPATCNLQQTATEPASLPQSTSNIIAEEAARLRRHRRELLEQNPIEWLAGRKRCSGWVWVSLGAVAAGWFAVCLETGRGASSDFVDSFYMAVSLHALLKFWIAWEAGRRFCEDRHNGTLESLLSTPLSVADLLRGQIKIIYHQFLGPVRAVLILDFILMSWLGSSSMFGASIAGMIASFALMMAMLVADAWALTWQGLWLGLKAKNGWTAAFGALARIILLPMCIFIVFAALRVSALGRTSGVVLWALIGGITSLLFGMSARSDLHTRFRQVVSDAPATESAPPPAFSPAELPELGEYYSLFKT